MRHISLVIPVCPVFFLSSKEDREQVVLTQAFGCVKGLGTLAQVLFDHNISWSILSNKVGEILQRTLSGAHWTLLKGRMSVFLYFILPALGGYILTSLYLLKNPHILHRRKRTAFYCTCISHRGGGGERIENTMEAFTHAVQQGTQMLELDCHLTHDGHVVVSHDENLLRQTGHDVTVSSLNLQDLPLYKERLEVTFYAGHYSSGADRKFALLEDVFRKFPKMPVSIEIKENNHQLIKKVSDLVRRYNREAFTVWASVNSRIMKECHRMNSLMPYSFTGERGVLLLLLFYTGLLPFVPLGESLLQFYLPRIFNRTFFSEKHILRNKLIISLLEKVTMRKSLLKHLAARGMQVHLFVCNEDDDIKAAFEVGATGVMSDYPTVLSTYIRKNRSQD
ncbi:lysophospholipase D GDPD3a [Xiphias gladius]|uniref:lysophospholipase D GDPD3a n=1 Tax=Xiphias gladius TaxID=8245 RepID=UPI001A98AAF4|nr:lysophospholipase D GDPD3a [Xiphias gladius]